MIETGPPDVARSGHTDRTGDGGRGTDDSAGGTEESTDESAGGAASSAGREPAVPAFVPLLSLTGLRFFAAFLVFGFHMHVMGLLDNGKVGRVLDWIFSQGAGGFSFFFLLSGFVLTWSVRPTDSTLRFWQRRLARIYPNHAVTWLVALGLMAVSSAGLSAAVALPNLFLVQAWVPSPRIYFGMNIVTWSLSCEIFFYALFPLLYRALVRLPGRALWPTVSAVFAVIWTVPFVAQVLPETPRYWAIWVFPPARLPEFVTGMLLALIVRSGRWPAFVSVRPAVLVAAAAYVGSRWLPADLRLVAGMAVPLALLVGAVAAVDASGRQTRWCQHWLLVLSEISYAFYLLHSLVLRVVLRIAGTSHSLLAELGIASVSLAITLCGSWLLYRYVEQPGRRLLRPRTATAPAPRVPTQPGADAPVMP